MMGELQDSGVFRTSSGCYIALNQTENFEWDYTVYDNDFRQIDGGLIGEGENYSFSEALHEICKLHDFEWEDGMADRIDDDFVSDLAKRLDQFAFDYDPYGYKDEYESRQDGLDEMWIGICSGKTDEIKTYLIDTVENDRDEEMIERANELLSGLAILESVQFYPVLVKNKPAAEMNEKNEVGDEDKKLEMQLKELCEQTGRGIEHMSNGWIVTYDMYEGTDAQYFESYEDAIEWEKGYLSSENDARNDQAITMLMY